MQQPLQHHLFPAPMNTHPHIPFPLVQTIIIIKKKNPQKTSLEKRILPPHKEEVKS